MRITRGTTAGRRRTAAALLAVSAAIAGVAVAGLVLLSEGRRDVVELIAPVLAASLLAAVIAAVGAAPYHLRRGRAPWPALWAASIAAILALTWALVAVAGWTTGDGGSIAMTALLGAPLVASSAIVAVPVTEGILRLRDRRRG
ncbi:hypothetical protein DZG00_02480 [Clavibacter lycopersici]|uniref:Uncharacterized protein n=3 Tax=Clavibacter lycopersici TaxID=2301718 RepID=A0A399TBX8_9MICO|nr:hypothetical protein [Clavibacter lycopersici]RIJ53038.1 hypothetical protein DZG00_02480 [Clavibacter lycopersici]